MVNNSNRSTRYKLTFYVRDASGKSFLNTEYFTNYGHAIRRAEETHGWLFVQKWQKIYPHDNAENKLEEEKNEL